MKLGLAMGYVDGNDVRAYLETATEADRLGYSVAWAAEAYGADAPTVLSHIAARTRRIDVGAAVMQIPARTPAMTAMTAATLDLLSEGRFRLGLGVSGPQVAEGWHGVGFNAPLSRSREYVDLVRQALNREVLKSDGKFYPLPLPGGRGKPLRLSLRPLRRTLPIYLAALGPKNLELAGEIADGCLSLFFSPQHVGEALVRIDAGRRRTGRSSAPFDLAVTVPVVFGADVAACAHRLRRHYALYIGGMGSRERNFYAELAGRMGRSIEAHRVQELYLAGRHRQAAAAVPLQFIDETSLLGPPERARERLQAFASAGVTTLNAALFEADPEGRSRVLRELIAVADAAGTAD